MAKPWITLTATHLKSSMTADEVARFGRAVTDGSPDDRSGPILADVIQEVRGMIKSCRQNTLSADDSKIPEEFKSKALAMARYRLLLTIPGYNPGKGREDQNTAAERFFEKVATCAIRPEESDDAVTPDVPEEKPHATPRIVSRGRNFTREKQEGI